VGAALEFLSESLRHIGAFEMLMMFLGEPIKGKGFLDIGFHPCAQLGILSLPLAQPDDQISPRLLDIAPFVKTSVIPLNSHRRLKVHHQRKNIHPKFLRRGSNLVKPNAVLLSLETNPSERPLFR
jgi:hypothetical protein